MPGDDGSWLDDESRSPASPLVEKDYTMINGLGKGLPLPPQVQVKIS